MITTNRQNSIADALMKYDSSLPIRKVEALGNYQAPFLEEKLGMGDLYQPTFEEFKKFAGLSYVSEGILGMPSKQVDDVWHGLILFTKEYQVFCEETLPHFLHHRPSVSSDKTTVGHMQNFIKTYESVYGPIPSLWGTKSNGKDYARNEDGSILCAGDSDDKQSAIKSALESLCSACNACGDAGSCGTGSGDGD